MTPVEEIIVRRLDQGAASISLAELGGEAAVLAQASDLVYSPLFAEVTRALVASHAVAETPHAIEALLLDGLRRLDDEIAFRGTVKAVIAEADIVGRIQTELSDVLIDRAKDRTTPADIRVEATEAAFRVAVPLADPPFDLLGLFERLRPGEDPRVLRRVPALIGLAFDHWRDDRLIGFLKNLTTDAQCAAEAYYELGMARLGHALAETEIAATIDGVRTAQEDFAAAAASYGDAVEAVAYDAALSLLLAFVDEMPATDLRDHFARLKDAVLTKEVWLHGTRPRPWLWRRLDVQLQWVMLGQSLIEAAEQLDQPSWWHIVDTLHGIFAVYVASRSYDLGGGPGLDGLLQPRIEAAFMRQAGLLKHLDDYLAKAEDDVLWRDTGTDLRRQIEMIARAGGTPPPGKPPGAAHHPA